MGIVDDELRYVMERFSERKLRINKLYLNSEDFRQICTDYYACVNMLIQLSTDDEQTSTAAEYKALKLSLESEILNYLDNFSDLRIR